MRQVTFAVLLTCCAHPQPVTHAPPGAIEVVVEHSLSDETWHVSYHLPDKVKQLRFDRAHYPFRVSNWKVTTLNVVIRETPRRR